MLRYKNKKQIFEHIRSLELTRDYIFKKEHGPKFAI